MQEILRVAVSMLNNKSGTAHKRWSSSSLITWKKNSHIYESQRVKNATCDHAWTVLSLLRFRDQWRVFGKG
jgi:hypothetical protein